MGMSYSTGNLGVSALAEGTIQGVLDATPHMRMSVVDGLGNAAEVRLTDERGEVVVPVHRVRFSPRALGPDHIGVMWGKALLLRLMPFYRLRRRIVGRSTALRALVEADAVLDISGGDSFADIYGVRHMIGQFTFKLLPLILGKRLVLLPQTIGPFRRYPWRALARFVLRKSALIYSRDPTVVDKVARFMGDSSSRRVRYAPDVAFLVPPASAAGGPISTRTLPPAWITVGVNVSGLLWNGGYTRANQFGLKADYRRVVHRVLGGFLADARVRVLLVPHVVTSWAGGVENDEEACRTIRAELPGELRERTEVVCGLRSAGGAKHVIGSCDFFIGSRMHACIAALSQGIPTVGVAYSDKFQGVFESLGVGNCVADPRREDEEGILRVVRDALASQDEIRSTLSRTVPIAKEQVRLAFRDIMELISNGR
jgi:polysaccharide pyruvyl transferase WcaK-like protein